LLQAFSSPAEKSRKLCSQFCFFSAPSLNKMPKTQRKYGELFPYGPARADDENVEPHVNGAGKNRGAAPASSGRVPLQPPSKGTAAAVSNRQQNIAGPSDGNDAERRRRILVREREDELTQKLALARRDARLSGSTQDKAAV
jgi:hypothetical protein